MAKNNPINALIAVTLSALYFVWNNLPNVLTSCRLLLTPLAMILLVRSSAVSLAGCLLVVVIIEITDFFDGFLARRWKKVSDFGKLYDPYCDVTFHLMMFLCLASLGILPLWIMAIFLFRELTVWFLRAYCATSGINLAARPWGKRKANAQTAMLVSVIVALGANLWGVPLAVDAGLMALSVIFTLAAVAATLISFGDYVNYFVKES
ncbi:MAG: CDP-diacylglycerol--glycerol-3-phosphate 3-phosphatidyltransferase [Patescibacteria group bacterium]|jgi:CDP-diacylglycerol--glycerol-3-phosphate 3-phosphatidyltransferase